ncbi:hypothetical protein P9A16_05670 [Shinella sp. 838]|jgi:hypothetical protein|uniref:hypothetical protein n=1 Tax=unclassified Shinella TaxID=2643062 RepID=UPI0003C546F1|nr:MULTISPECIES: hypothetical protein [unclassified Shinella]EYR77835.1 hypothetical protein SHLA_34c000470 [Shinella sp. DD12]MDG4670602.1 hypothetical protein [Shinella sp. 838]
MTSMGKAGFVSGMVFTWSAATAMATPPDALSVRDEVFGVGAREILVLRTVSDNLGSYNATVSTVFVVLIDAATAQEALWPVYRTRLVPDYESDPSGLTPSIRNEALAQRRDAFDLLSERKALPAGSASARGETPDVMTYSMQAGIDVRYLDGTRYGLTAGELRRRWEIAADQLAAAMEPYDRLGPLAAVDLIDDGALDLSACTLADPATWSLPVGAGSMQVLRITCEGEGLSWSRLLVVPSRQK